MYFTIALFCIALASLSIYIVVLFSSTTPSNTDDNSNYNDYYSSNWNTNEPATPDSHVESDVVDGDLDENERCENIEKNILRKSVDELTAGSFGKLYSLVGYLGSNRYAEVYTAREKVAKAELFVVKFVRRKHFKDSEIEILWKVKGHPNIVEIIRVGRNDNYTQIMTSLEGDMSFAEYLALSPGITEKKLRFFFNQMTAGVKFLHSKSIAHLDLKPKNMVIRYDLKLTIIDFVFSKDLSIVGNGPFEGSFGTAEFLAPEMMQNNRQCLCYPKEADIWALGVTLFLSFFGRFPYQITKDLRIISKISPYSKVRRKYSAELKDLLDKMLRFACYSRPSIHDVTEHCWSKESTLVTNVTEIFDYHEDVLKIQQSQEASSPAETREVKIIPPTVVTDLALIYVFKKSAQRHQRVEAKKSPSTNTVTANISTSCEENSPVIENEKIHLDYTMSASNNLTEEPLQIDISNKLLQANRSTECTEIETTKETVACKGGEGSQTRESGQKHAAKTSSQMGSLIEATKTDSSNSAPQLIPLKDTDQTALFNPPSQLDSLNGKIRTTLPNTSSQTKSSEESLQVTPSVEIILSKQQTKMSQLTRSDYVITSNKFFQIVSSNRQFHTIPVTAPTQMNSLGEPTQVTLPNGISEKITPRSRSKIVLRNQRIHISYINESPQLKLAKENTLTTQIMQPTRLCEDVDKFEKSELVVKGARIFIQGALTLYHGYWPF